MSKTRGGNWKPQEDIALCIAVITVGEDGDKGTAQEKKKLWDRINAVYETCKPANAEVRGGGGCDGRWRKIRPACQRWREALNIAASNRKSGDNPTDEELQAKSSYRTLSQGHNFEFEHCWPILKDSKKFSNPPTMYVGGTPRPSPVNLDEEDTPTDGSPANTPVDVRPPGQKAQKAAKKKSRMDDTSQLLEQMKRIADQGDCDLKYRLSFKEEAKLAQQCADDAATMAVDPSGLPTHLRTYWEKKQAMVIEKELRESMARENPQASTPYGEDNPNFDPYMPVHETQWME